MQERHLILKHIHILYMYYEKYFFKIQKYLGAGWLALVLRSTVAPAEETHTSAKWNIKTDNNHNKYKRQTHCCDTSMAILNGLLFSNKPKEHSKQGLYSIICPPVVSPHLCSHFKAGRWINTANSQPVRILLRRSTAAQEVTSPSKSMTPYSFRRLKNYSRIKFRPWSLPWERTKFLKGFLLPGGSSCSLYVGQTDPTDMYDVNVWQTVGHSLVVTGS